MVLGAAWSDPTSQSRGGGRRNASQRNPLRLTDTGPSTTTSHVGRTHRDCTRLLDPGLSGLTRRSRGWDGI
eukprot:6160193-Prymnesium_polylepis.1